MAKQKDQLNFLAKPSGGQIIPTSLHTEMSQSYLEYAMSVIVGRALPDVRDGLKPVHRRILYAMHELGLTPDRPYRKCARVVGDVLGKYHPHGDQSVYDALVRLVQDFSSRYPLLAGHGNFGSVDNDPAAAMRYTECRLSAMGNETLLQDVVGEGAGESIVNFVNNFDGSEQEPAVLPAQLPWLLLNGASGIAVGMATNIPPHNLGEVVDGLIALIDQPNLSDVELLRYIPGPDFPTGGLILNPDGVKELYTTGRGSITMRGVVSLEQLGGKGTGKRSRQALIITELPYQVNKAAWIEKIAELVNQGKLDGIAELRDESDRQGMRVVIELKRDIDPEKILGKLYRQTALQSNFGGILLALDGASPQQMQLRQILQAFLRFREETLSRRFKRELNKNQQKLHLIDGFVLVLQEVNRLVDLLRFAPDTATAKTQLQQEFSLSEVQANAVLDLPLRRITTLDQQNLQKEQATLQQQIQRLEKLLGDRKESLKFLKKELREIKKRHNDERRTKMMWSQEEWLTKWQTELEQATLNAPPADDLLFDPSLVDVPSLPLLSINSSVTDSSVDESDQLTDSVVDDEETNTIEVSSQNATPSQPSISDTSVITPAVTTPTAVKRSRSKRQAIEDIPLFLNREGAGTTEQSQSKDFQILITAQGKVYRAPVNQNPANQTEASNPPTNTDINLYHYTAEQEQSFLLFSTTGRVFGLDSKKLPKQYHDVLPLSLEPDEQIFIAYPQLKELSKELKSDAASTTEAEIVLVTTQGRAKRIAYNELADISARGLIATRLRGDDTVFWAGILPPDIVASNFRSEIMVATSAGRILRLPINQDNLPTMTRQAIGETLLRMGSNEVLVACGLLHEFHNPTTEFLLVTAEGFAKRLNLGDIRSVPRGSIGTQSCRFRSRSDTLACVLPLTLALDATPIQLILQDNDQRTFRKIETFLGDIPLENPNSAGIPMIRDLGYAERVIRCQVGSF
jgi:DNA gyrase subunit A